MYSDNALRRDFNSCFIYTPTPFHVVEEFFRRRGFPQFERSQQYLRYFFLKDTWQPEDNVMDPSSFKRRQDAPK